MEKLFTSPTLIEAISFVMSQEMLSSIQHLDEHTTRVPPKRARSPRQQTTVLALASVQLSLATTAWADPDTLPDHQLNGGNGMCAAIIAVHFLGPARYFTRGVRHQP